MRVLFFNTIFWYMKNIITKHMINTAEDAAAPDVSNRTSAILGPLWGVKRCKSSSKEAKMAQIGIEQRRRGAEKYSFFFRETTPSAQRSAQMRRPRTANSVK